MKVVILAGGFGTRFSEKTKLIPKPHHKSWINQNTLNCANYILDNITVDHAWDTHENNYNFICEKLNLEKTSFIHVAKQNGKTVGVAKILEKIIQ